MDPFKSKKDVIASVSRDPFAALPPAGGNPYRGAHPWEVEDVKKSLGDDDERQRARDPFGAASRPPATRDPFGAAAPTPADEMMAELMAGPAPGGGGGGGAWQSERQKLAKWESGGQVRDRPELAHLSGYLGKDLSSSGAASAALGAAVRAEASKPGPYEVPDPVFDDAHRSEFLCDVCHAKTPRGDFADEQLRQLGDCKEERQKNNKTCRGAQWGPPGGELEGPWRGMIVRLHMNGHGYVHTPQLFRKFGCDIYCHAKFVLRALGGSLGLTKEMDARGLVEGDWQTSKQEFARVQYNLEISGPEFKAQPEGTVMVREMTKIRLVCKNCERRRKMREKMEKEQAAKIAASVNASLPASSSLAKPLVKGFDPQAKIANMLGNLRQKIGVPQPGTPGALPTPAIRGMAGQTSAEIYGKQYGGWGKGRTDLLKSADQSLDHKRKQETPLTAPMPPAKKQITAKDPFLDAQ